MKIPKNIYGNSECILNEENNSYNTKLGAIPTKVFKEYKESEIDFYISTEYLYITEEDNSECKIQENSIDFIKLTKHKVMKMTYFSGIKNDEDLKAFIKKFYLPGCEDYSKKESTQEGVYDIYVDNSGPEGDCFLNYSTFTKYYPSKEAIIFGVLGQSPNLFGDEDYSTAYDLDIIRSIKFN